MVVNFIGIKFMQKMTGIDESWRDKSVAQRNLHLLNSGFMADCTFVVGMTESERKKMRCHKFILSQGSPVFYAMFNGDLKEKGEVKVEDIEPQHFWKMLEFIYCDHTKLENVESALSVCYAGHKYMINTLTLKCIDSIKRNLDPDIVCRALEFARFIDNFDLVTQSLQYLKINTRDVLKSASFPYAERATLITLLSQDTCDITEMEMFSACVRWAKAHKRDAGDSLREVLGPDVLSLIRFLTMTAQEFATVVIPSKLLQLQEEQDILCRLVTGSGNVPRGFNNNTEIRPFWTGPKEIVAIGTNPNRRNMKSRFINGLNCYNGQALNNSPFNFSVNFECFIFGLQLGGLVNYDSVEDRFEVNLLQDFELLSSAQYEGLMSHGKNVEVNFDKPVLLKANTSYSLQMKYSNLHLSYACTQRYKNVFSTTAGVRMNVNFNATAISQICLARKCISDNN